MCPECYDCDGSVIRNASAGKLRHIYVGRIGREPAKAAGVRRESAALREQLRVSYVDIVEYQRRGLVREVGRAAREYLRPLSEAAKTTSAQSLRTTAPK